MRNRIQFGVMLLGLLLVPMSVFAQAPEPVAPPDFHKIAVDLVTAAIPILTIGVTWLTKVLIAKATDRHFPWVLPFVALAAANGLAYVTQLASVGHYDPMVATLLGGAAVYLREVVTTFQQHGVTGKVVQ